MRSFFELPHKLPFLNLLVTGVLGGGNGGSSIPRLEGTHKSNLLHTHSRKETRNTMKAIPTFV
jgi:hypothetical protein